MKPEQRGGKECPPLFSYCVSQAEEKGKASCLEGLDFSHIFFVIFCNFAKRR